MTRRSGTGLSARVQSIPRLTSLLLSEEDDGLLEATPGKNAGGGNDANELSVVVAVRICPLVLPKNEKGGISAVEEQQQQQQQVGEEEPIVDVETDGKTVVLLDPANRGVSRATFAFEHIISALAPSVEVDIISSPSSADLRQEQQQQQQEKKKMVVKNAETPTDFPRCNTNTGLNTAIGGLGDAEELEQQRIFQALGVPVVEWSLRGFNACIFAYGQSGSGKTYTMIGSTQRKGIIPRLCHLLLCRLSDQILHQEPQHQPQEDVQRKGPRQQRLQRQRSRLSRRQVDQELQDDDSHLASLPCSPSVNSSKGCTSPRGSTSSSAAQGTKITISFMEIYNERIRDLLKREGRGRGSGSGSRFGADSAEGHEALKVRHSPSHGPFVEGLTTVNVTSWEECERYIFQGNAARSHATTSINESSSRSHAIFQLILTQTVSLGGRVRGREVTMQRVSKINLVDLAGSERNSQMGNAKNERRASETNAINLSLSVLRRVIDALVNRSKVVPYRESLLTYVLADNFGGNSRTVMCATISPHASRFAETEATLRYASLARGIVNRVKVNEHPYAKIIRELRERIKSMQEELRRHTTSAAQHAVSEEKSVGMATCTPDELRQRELQLIEVLEKSRQRESELLENLQKMQEDEKKWKNEAQWQKKKKEQLMTALKDLAQQKPELVAQGVIKIPTDEGKDEAVARCLAMPYVSPTRREACLLRPGVTTSLKGNKPDHLPEILPTLGNPMKKSLRVPPTCYSNNGGHGTTTTTTTNNNNNTNSSIGRRDIPNDDGRSDENVAATMLHHAGSMQKRPSPYHPGALSKAQLLLGPMAALVCSSHGAQPLSLTKLQSGIPLSIGPHAVAPLPVLTPLRSLQSPIVCTKGSLGNGCANALVSRHPSLALLQNSSFVSCFRECTDDGCTRSSDARPETSSRMRDRLCALASLPEHLHSPPSEDSARPRSILTKRSTTSTDIPTPKV